jgi:hypothetical protein
MQKRVLASVVLRGGFALVRVYAEYDDYFELVRSRPFRAEVLVEERMEELLGSARARAPTYGITGPLRGGG